MSEASIKSSDAEVHGTNNLTLNRVEFVPVIFCKLIKAPADRAVKKALE